MHEFSKAYIERALKNRKISNSIKESVKEETGAKGIGGVKKELADTLAYKSERQRSEIYKAEFGLANSGKKELEEVFNLKTPVKEEKIKKTSLMEKKKEKLEQIKIARRNILMRRWAEREEAGGSIERGFAGGAVERNQSVGIGVVRPENNSGIASGASRNSVGAGNIQGDDQANSDPTFVQGGLSGGKLSPTKGTGPGSLPPGIGGGILPKV